MISSHGSAFPLSTKYNAQHRWIPSQSPSDLELWCVVARTARWTKRPFVCDLRPQTLCWCHVMAKPMANSSIVEHYLRPFLLTLLCHRKHGRYSRLTHWCRNEMDNISRTTLHSQTYFLDENARISFHISLISVPNVRIKRYSRIGSDNGLAPSRLIHRRTYTSLGPSELKQNINLRW